MDLFELVIKGIAILYLFSLIVILIIFRREFVERIKEINNDIKNYLKYLIIHYANTKKNTNNVFKHTPTSAIFSISQQIKKLINQETTKDSNDNSPDNFEPVPKGNSNIYKNESYDYTKDKCNPSYTHVANSSTAKDSQSTKRELYRFVCTLVLMLKW
jgi:hypothetical protein